MDSLHLWEASSLTDLMYDSFCVTYLDSSLEEQWKLKAIYLNLFLFLGPCSQILIYVHFLFIPWPFPPASECAITLKVKNDEVTQLLSQWFVEDAISI